MRTIKFRFWTPDKRMIDDHEGWVENIGINYALKCSSDSGYIAMQFTGLLDKNGVEIYEGDIIKMHQFLFDGNEVENELTGVVEYLTAEFGLTTIRSTYWQEQTGFGPGEDKTPLSSFYGLHEESFEVIGNIHQNPELIETNKEGE